MKPLSRITIVYFIFFCFYACGSIKPFYGSGSAPVQAAPENQNIRYSLFLAGGVPLDEHAPVMAAMLAAAPPKAGLVLLGDEFNLDDLPAGSIDEMTSGNTLFNLLHHLDETYKDFYIIPGEEEWTLDKNTSSTNLRTIDKLLKDVKEKGRLVSPAKDCGSPDVVRLTDHTILVLIDSQWAVETVMRPGEKIPGSELSSILELRVALKGIIQSHPDDYIILASHHPVYANGPTAGNYPLSSHLLPLPVLGTFITGIKTLVGSNQHFGHPAYEAYRSMIKTVVDDCPNCLVVSGHEKSLQYYRERNCDYFIAGSGDDFGYARKGEHAGFSYMSSGFFRVDEMKDETLKLSFYAVRSSGPAELVWEKVMSLPKEPTVENTAATNRLAEGQDSIVVQASTQYEHKHFLRGEFYRKAWGMPIKMPVFRLDQEFGGLSPLQLGGGHQTRSLRMENKVGAQYVLRSIDKKVTVVLPPALRGSFAESVVQEGIAASHPYGALVVPQLASAAGVFYTNPRVVYVPHQAALGLYDRDIGDGVYILEERPGGNTSVFENFGNTEKTFNTADIIEMTAESHQHIVDQHAVLRARLFDIWLGDWDRHDDQWRWAAFKENGINVYRPIPRDRDQVFYKNDGVLDYLASRPYFNPALRMFSKKIDHLSGLIWPGKFFDHSFLHQLTEADFVAEAQTLQKELTDEVIDRAFKDWPAKIDSLDGPRIREDLRQRRDDLVTYARKYFALINKEVFIPATTDKDIIHISSTAPGKLDVTITRNEKNLNYPFYHREFDDHITKELRVFGLNKQDSFLLDGPYHTSTVIRMIGGSGDDILVNQAPHLRVKTYDSDGGMTISGKHVSEHLNDRPLNNSYDRTDWNLNRNFHFLVPTYYTDEGIGINYTYWWTRYGFRADPYRSKHSLGLSYYFGHNGFIGRYKGDWHHLFGEMDFTLASYVTGPTFTQYFYGLGNTYRDFGQKKNYHIVSGSQINIMPALSRRFGIGNRIEVSPTFQYIDIDDSDNKPRFIYTPESGVSPEDLGRHEYVGLTATYSFTRIDNSGYPVRGLTLQTYLGGRTSIGASSNQNALLGISGSLYIPFDVTGTFVLATRIGLDKLFGNYPFYQALTLGGEGGLRGYRSDRFAGNARYFQSTDFRIKIFHKQGAVPIQIGIYASFDYGRVWYEGDQGGAANKLHTAVGGGVFIVPLGLTSFRLGYMAGEKDYQLILGGALKL
ncbi:MAG TPA: hypothetical protein VJ508_16250 [Saprospiraceae bacterium]|nr:hypothetical protein [Saprospiraceae bacterium]